MSDKIIKEDQISYISDQLNDITEYVEDNRENGIYWGNKGAESEASRIDSIIDKINQLLENLPKK